MIITGVEFIKNGSRLREHLDRLNETYGKYREALLKYMKDLIIVDIYENHLNKGNINTVVETGFSNHYLIVLFKDNFETVEFYKINEQHVYERVDF